MGIYNVGDRVHLAGSKSCTGKIRRVHSDRIEILWDSQRGIGANNYVYTLRNAKVLIVKMPPPKTTNEMVLDKIKWLDEQWKNRTKQTPKPKRVTTADEDMEVIF